MHKRLSKKELRELQQQTLLNILSVGKLSSLIIKTNN